jgi:hypothetical protein
MTKADDPCTLFDEFHPFGVDNRPRFDCYKEGHEGPYVIGGPVRGVCCRKCYADAQKVYDWLSPKKPEEPLPGHNPR